MDAKARETLESAQEHDGKEKSIVGQEQSLLQK